MGAAWMGCHVFSPGLSPRDASRPLNPDGPSPGLESPSPEDALPADTQEALYGLTSKVGCSDGTREGFRVLSRWPSIAGCAGGWQKPGLTTPRSCAGEVGNSSPNSNGVRCPASGPCVDCSATDLCAEGWHLCKDGQDVLDHSDTGCENILAPGERGIFIAMTGASTDGVCEKDKQNDLHGCGNLGSPESDQCPPFIRRMGYADCDNTGGVWQCGPSALRLNETKNVTKSNSDLGGVLCCKD
jgi:hypothetical protein